MSWQAKSKKESHRKILEALIGGGKTWSELVEATGLSKHTLYNHFPEMEREGLIRRELEAEPGRRAKILYALTEKGEQRAASLREEMFMELMEKGFAETISATLRTLQSYFRSFISVILGEEYENCVSFTLSHETQIRNKEELEEYIRTALSYLLSQYIDNPEDLEEITEADFNLTFRFDRSAVMKILREKEEARKTRKPIWTRPPPRPEDYINKKEDLKDHPKRKNALQ